MNIIIIGYYGCNFGDNLMLQGIVTQYDKNNYNIVVLSYADMNSNSVIYNNCTYSSYCIKRISLKDKIKFFHNSDYIIWGGGSCFNDVDGTGAIKQMLLAKFINPQIKIIYSAVGIDVKNNRLHKLYLKLVILISNEFSVRDNMSLEYVRNKKVFLCKDLIYNNISMLESIAPYELNNYLLVSYRNIDAYFPDKTKVYLGAFISYIIKLVKNENFRNIVVFNCDIVEDKNDNLTIVQNLKEKLGNTNIVYNETADIKAICSLIKGADYVITGRLHAAVVANYFSRQFKLLNYSKKNEAFVAEVNQKSCLLEYEELIG